MVATPIGNLQDLSRRAVAVLTEADLVLAEDTRTGARLLKELGLSKPLVSCFDANEPHRADQTVAWLREGRTLALMSEAGTPGVSDPGFRVVQAAIEAGAQVIPVPGPSALLPALVGSGLPTDRFVFLGFPPRKRSERRRQFEAVRGLPYTLVFYESPYRTGETLGDLEATLGGHRRACVARELTKTHEEFIRGTLGELAQRFGEDRPLGEITLVVAGAAAVEDDRLAEATVAGAGSPAGATEALDDPEQRRQARIQELLAQGRSARDVADIVAAETGQPRRKVYGEVLKSR